MLRNQARIAQFRRALLAGLVVAAGLGCAASSVAQPPSPPEKIVVPATVQVLDLTACRRLALEKQPAIAAAEASLAAAEARSAALCKLHAIPIVASDLPIRRQQATLGIASAQAQVEQARWDTLYDVTRSYLTVLYARQQLKVADDTLADLKKTRQDAKDAGKARMERQANVYISAVEGRRETALAGATRALAALREAIGLPPDAAIEVADTQMPDINVMVSRDDVIAQALARRGEMLQATSAAEATGFEIKAQESKHFAPTARTFASGSDIHAQPIPPAGHGAEYAPAAVGPEMPTILVGKRADRVEQARALSARADSVVEKTRGLLTLEADDAYNRWLEGSRKLPKTRAAAKEAVEVADELSKDVKNLMLDVRYSDVTFAKTVASTLRLEANETHYQLLLNLAALERITAGGFIPGFEAPPAK
jgi:outer membrane protein TolC